MEEMKDLDPSTGSGQASLPQHCTLGKRPEPCPHLLNPHLATVAQPGVLSVRGPGSRPSSAASNHAQNKTWARTCVPACEMGNNPASMGFGDTNKTAEKEETRRKGSQEGRGLGSEGSWSEFES